MASPLRGSEVRSCIHTARGSTLIDDGWCTILQVKPDRDGDAETVVETLILLNVPRFGTLIKAPAGLHGMTRWNV